MSLFGKLEDTSLSELLQVIATSRVTGKLRLTGHDREGLIVFRKGQVVYAASSSARQTLGSLLLLEGLVSENELSDALDRQHAAKEEVRLGNLLIEMGAIDEETLTRVVRHQTERVMTEFLTWEKGYFKLDPVELGDFGEVEVDATEFLMREGLTTDALLTDLEARIEEFKASEMSTEDLDDDPEEQAAIPTSPGSLSTLKSLMGEIRSPQFTGEISQKILSYANELFSRGVLFVVRQDGFGVMGRFGVHSDDGKAETRLRQLLIPTDQPSVLSESAGRKESVVGVLDDCEWNQNLLEAIGGAPEGPAVAVPMVVNDKVLLVLYGDHLLGDLSPDWLEELELLVLQAGLAMEKDLLVKRIEHYENLRRHD